MSRFNAALEWILRLPLVWGGVACLSFYALLSYRIIDSPFLERYCAHHVVEIVEMTVFFIGLAALTMRFSSLVVQFTAFDQVVLDPIPIERQSIDECGQLIAQIRSFPERIQRTYLVRRLSDAISYVRRTGSADALEDHLRHLEEQESLQIQSSYSMIRIIVWAIPILGLLGTVIGITIAVANLNPATMEESITKVTGGLAVAFDHTATALTLTMILMFIKSGVERMDDSLLSKVDERVAAELVGRFEQTGLIQDPSVLTVRQMSEQLLSTLESLGTRQADAWGERLAEVSASAGRVVNESLAVTIKDSLTDKLAESVRQHAEKLDHSAQETVGRLRDGLEKLAELFVESLHKHGEVLTISEQELAQENRRHLSEVEAALSDSMVVAADRQEKLIKQSEHLLKEMQIALVEAAGATVRQQEQLIKQGDVLLQVVDATGQIKKLESSLNQNLATLRQGYNFEELALNLSAAIQLLCARMGHLPASAWTAEAGDERVSQAA